MEVREVHGIAILDVRRLGKQRSCQVHYKQCSNADYDQGGYQFLF